MMHSVLNIKHFVRLVNQVVKTKDLPACISNEGLLKSFMCSFLRKDEKRSFHVELPRMSREESIEMKKAQQDAKRKEDLGEPSTVGLDDSLNRKADLFPTKDLPDQLFDGIPFKLLPIVTINASRNNTVIGLTDKDIPKIIRSCGTEGFKNARKGTNVAAQTAGVALGLKAVKKGYKTVRVVIKGLGPGRLSAIKGLQLGGMNIISITDATVDQRNWQRPRKQRRL